MSQKYGAFKPCQKYHIHELNAHEQKHKVMIASGKLWTFFEPRVSELRACQWENMADKIDAASVVIVNL